jgi:5-methylcytosine-specific restriction endonuclease McrA
MPECKKCSKTYTARTLKKHGGVCGRCSSKQSIPKMVREAVWVAHAGDKFNGKCYMCECGITATNFQAGHIQAEAKGGEVSVKNLRPVCKKCNSRVGTFNMDTVKKALDDIGGKKSEYIARHPTKSGRIRNALHRGGYL